MRRAGNVAIRARKAAGVLVLRLFGQARIEADDAIRPIRAPAKAVEAFAYLAANHNAPVSREFLAALLWPTMRPRKAAPNCGGICTCSRKRFRRPPNHISRRRRTPCGGMALPRPST